MSRVIRDRNKLIFMAPEPTYADDSVTPGVGDYQRAMDMSITYEQEDVQDEVEQGFEGNVEEIPNGEHVSLSYKTHLVCSGTRGVRPPLADAFLACRFAEVVETDTRVRYVIAEGQGGSVATYFRIGSNLHVIRGMRGMVDLVMEKGIPMLQWQFKGLFETPQHTADALPRPNNAPWLNYRTTGPGRTLNFSFHGVAMRPYSLNLNTGNEPIYDQSLVDAQVLFNERKASSKMQIEALPLDVINLYQTNSTRTHGPLSIQHRTEPGHIFKMNCPLVQNKKPAYVKLNTGNTGYDVDLMPLPVNGNDEYEFIFE